MAAETEKKNTENIKPETDQDTTPTSTTWFGKQTVNKGYELKPENSGASKQIKRKHSERKQSSSPPEKIHNRYNMYSGQKTIKTGQVNRKSTELETKKNEKMRSWLRGTRKVLGRSEVKRNTKLFLNISAQWIQITSNQLQIKAIQPFTRAITAAV